MEETHIFGQDPAPRLADMAQALFDLADANGIGAVIVLGVPDGTEPKGWCNKTWREANPETPNGQALGGDAPAV